MGGYNPGEQGGKVERQEGREERVSSFLDDMVKLAKGYKNPTAKRFVLAVGMLASASGFASELPESQKVDQPEIAFSHQGKVGVTEKKIGAVEKQVNVLMREVAMDEQNVAQLERTQEDRMRNKMIMVDADLAAAKRDLRHDANLLEITQEREKRLEDKLQRNADAWGEGRTRRQKVLDIGAIADDKIDAQLAGWGVDVCGNTMQIPLPHPKAGAQFEVITADATITGVAFYEVGTDQLRVVFEDVAGNYGTVVIDKGTFKTTYASNARGDQLK